MQGELHDTHALDTLGTIFTRSRHVRKSVRYFRDTAVLKVRIDSLISKIEYHIVQLCIPESSSHYHLKMQESTHGESDGNSEDLRNILSKRIVLIDLHQLPASLSEQLVEVPHSTFLTMV